jgi:hypothetical protein
MTKEEFIQKTNQNPEDMFGSGYEDVLEEKCPICGEMMKEKYISSEYNGHDISCYAMVCLNCKK